MSLASSTAFPASGGGSSFSYNHPGTFSIPAVFLEPVDEDLSKKMVKALRQPATSQSIVPSSETQGGSSVKTGKPGMDGWDLLAKSSLGAMTLVNMTMLFSPVLKKAARGLLVSPQFQKNTFAQSPLFQKALHHIADEKNEDLLLKTLTRLNAYTALAQLNTGYQVGINTEQPSKSVSSLLGTLTQLATIWKPGILYGQAISYFSSFFWFSGETNDINNNNNPDHRREWDQRRLFKACRGQADSPGLLSELKSLGAYIAKDAAYTLSFAPWKNLIQSFQQKDSLTKPQPYQTAIGAQLNFLGFLGATGAFLSQLYTKWKNPDLKLKITEFGRWKPELKKIPERFSHFTKIVMVFSVISYLPVLMRAMQNKGDADGILTFVGVPLVTAKQVLIGGLALKNWQGLFNLGGPIVNEGKRVNSKKYRAQVNVLQALYQEAQSNPSLTAQQVLRDLQAHPEDLKIMAATMGQSRVTYLLNLLQTGVKEEAQDGTSLSDYLLPVMKAGA